MNRTITVPLSLITLAVLCACGSGGGDPHSAPAVMLASVTTTPAPAPAPAPAPPPPAVPAPLPNPEGSALTFSTTGSIDPANAFFKPLGNGRSCASCHTQAAGWSISPPGLQARFNATQGTDPVFRLLDGANSPEALSTTLDQKRLAYSMLLTKGVIRVGLAMPANAEFTLVRTDDPYNFASARELSLFRRPLASANLKFNASVMWDGRETLPGASLDANLLHQANTAVRGHAEAAVDLTAAEQRAIVDFEKSLFTAQISSASAGSLVDAGARGGPALLAVQDFSAGINDSAAPAFERIAMTLFGAWRTAADVAAPSAQDLARASVARGEALFNTRPINIVQVPGAEELRLPQQRGTCTSCHNAPNGGSHSVARLFNTGVSAGAGRTPDMPLYGLRHKVTGEVVETTDPGSAMVSGRWVDVGKFKTPVLRGMGSRAPYFHDGSARDLDAVVRFYDRRFRMGLNPQEVADLTAFLRVL